MNTYVVVFIACSFLGWVWESIYCTLVDRKWANRGFLYGPICPIYGAGSVVGLAFYQLAQQGVIPTLAIWQIFVGGFVLSMVLEFPTSLVLEKLFQARWWDYSDIPLNIDGRTSVPTSLAFGGAAILVMKFLIPALSVYLAYISAGWMNFLALVFVAILFTDITLTVSAITNFQSHVDTLSDTFQYYMTETVCEAFAVEHRFHQRAVNRIVSFRVPLARAAEIRKLREDKFKDLVKKYFAVPEVHEMKQYIQHGDISTLEHSENVAWVSFLVNEKMRLNADEKKLVESAMLHDFYLYDWHDGEPERKTHGFHHPSIAAKNAQRFFQVDKETQDAIGSHMWPLTITKVPRSKEAMILCIVDKYCAIIETLRKKTIEKPKNFRAQAVNTEETGTEEQNEEHNKEEQNIAQES